MIILIPGFAASGSDSVCLPLHQAIVSQLSRQYPGVKIVICAFHYPFHRGSYTLHGAEVQSFGGRNKSGLHRWLLKRRVLHYLSDHFNSGNSFAILSFWYGECAEVAETFSKRTGIKHYCWLMGQDAKAENTFPSRLKIPAERIIALSDSLKDTFSCNHQLSAMTVIPPGLKPCNPELSTLRNIDILAVGSLIPLKQFHTVVEIARELISEFPKLKVMIVGEGSERTRIESLIDKYDLKKVVTLCGEISHEEVIAMMQRSKLLLHPSEYEGFSGVCQEALANGCDVISFCKPMRSDIFGWTIVKDQHEMKVVAAKQILHFNNIREDRNPYKLQDTTAVLMNLLLG